MTVVVRAPASGGGGGGGSGDTPAVNYRGDVVGLAPQAITTLASGSAIGWKLRGFAAFGDNDIVVWVELDGTPVEGIIARGSVVKVATLILPNPEPMLGTTVALKVKNDAPSIGGVSATIEGTLFGE